MTLDWMVQLIAVAAGLLVWLAGFTGSAPVTEGVAPIKGPEADRPAWLDTLMFRGGGSSSGSNEAKRQEEERQKRIRQSTQRINSIFDQFGSPGTDSSLYDQYQQDYLSHYTPQLEQQFEDAQKAVQYDLARRGATESASGQQRLADLLEAYSKQQTQLQSQATQAMNQYRGSVEQQRQALISQAQSGMAPTDAASLATSAFNSLQSQQPEYSALGDMFSQFADIYGTGLRAQGAGFQGYNVPGTGSAGGLPGRSGTSTVRN